MDLAVIERRLEIEGLYTAYAHCLDDDRLEEWPEFFTEDCAYRVTSAENFAAGLPLGIIYATSKNMLVDRVMALRQANIYEPQRYRHLISCVEIANGEGDTVASRPQRTQAAGTAAGGTRSMRAPIFWWCARCRTAR